MNNNMKQYQHMGWKTLTLFFALCLAIAGTTSLSSCSSQDDPYYTVSEDDTPRILNTDLVDQNLNRVTPLNIEIKVTPRNFTKVTWLLNGTQIHEGFTINQLVPVGNHELKIVATTVKGLTTSRSIKVNVTPMADDPSIATDAKTRWLTIGKTKTVSCEHVTSISKLLIGDVEATNVSYADNKITFDVPSMAEGEYLVTLVDAQGTKWGCGLFTVSTEDYPDPGIKETTIWEGDVTINWGDSKVFIPAAEMADVPVGATVRLVYEMVDAEYHCMRVTNEDWSADIVAQFDLTESGAYEFEFTADSKAIADAKGMLVTGFGYKLTQVVIVEGVAPAENTLWEGSKDINWGDSNVFIPAADMAAVAAGSKIHVYYEMIDAEYHCMRITNEDWSSDIVAQFDITADTAIPYEFDYTADSKAIGDAKGMLVTGFGYKITKVTYSE